MSESIQDMLGRLSGMSRGEPTWDLSDNDCAAIKWVLNETKSLRARIRELEQALLFYRLEHSKNNCYFSGPTAAVCDECEAVDRLMAALHITDKTARCRNCGRMRSDHVFGISGVPGCWNNSASTTFEPEVTDKAAKNG